MARAGGGGTVWSEICISLAFFLFGAIFQKISGDLQCSANFCKYRVDVDSVALNRRSPRMFIMIERKDNEK